MYIQLDIQLADDLSDSQEDPPSSSMLCLWAQAAWQGNDTAEPNLSLRIVSALESQQLNHDYRGKNTPTNILSFPMLMEIKPSEISDVILGDLAICAEIVEHEAQQQQISRHAHWAHMMIHGMLHLQGYDHIKNNEAEAMEKLETQIMLGLGFSDPYQQHINIIDKTPRIDA